MNPTPDEARAELDTLDAAASAAAVDATAAAEEFVAKPSDKTALRRVVSEQRAANARAELEAARERLSPVFERERAAAREKQIATYAAHAAKLRAALDRELAALPRLESALAAGVNRLRQLFAEHTATALELDRMSGGHHDRTPSYQLPAIMARAAGPASSGAWRAIWNPEHADHGEDVSVATIRIGEEA